MQTLKLEFSGLAPRESLDDTGVVIEARVISFDGIAAELLRRPAARGRRTGSIEG